MTILHNQLRQNKHFLLDLVGTSQPASQPARNNKSWKWVELWVESGRKVYASWLISVAFPFCFILILELLFDHFWW